MSRWGYTLPYLVPKQGEILFPECCDHTNCYYTCLGYQKYYITPCSKNNLHFLKGSMFASEQRVHGSVGLMFTIKRYLLPIGTLKNNSKKKQTLFRHPYVPEKCIWACYYPPWEVQSKLSVLLLGPCHNLPTSRFLLKRLRWVPVPTRSRREAVAKTTVFFTSKHLSPMKMTLWWEQHMVWCFKWRKPPYSYLYTFRVYQYGSAVFQHISRMLGLAGRNLLILVERCVSLTWDSGSTLWLCCGQTLMEIFPSLNYLLFLTLAFLTLLNTWFRVPKLVTRCLLSLLPLSLLNLWPFPVFPQITSGIRKYAFA